jgi:hypothetical protein
MLKELLCRRTKMAPVKCRVHQLGKGDPDKRVVRIRATAFQAFQSKRFIVRITSSKGSQRKSAYFEAEYRRRIEVELNWTPIPGSESFSP